MPWGAPPMQPIALTPHFGGGYGGSSLPIWPAEPAWSGHGGMGHFRRRDIQQWKGG